MVIFFLFKKQYLNYFLDFINPKHIKNHKKDQLSLLIISGILAVVLIKLFNISSVYLMWLLLTLCPVIFVIFTCKAQEHKQRQEYLELNTFLSYFISSFSQCHNIYSSLIEIKSNVSPEFHEIIESMIINIDDGMEVSNVRESLISKYNHFIVHNMFNYMDSVQTYGDNESSIVLNSLHKDLDDWFEDTLAYRDRLIQILNRIKLLIVFSIIICFFAKNMLVQVGLNLNNVIYQMCIYIFLYTLIITLLVAYVSITDTWIEEKECI